MGKLYIALVAGIILLTQQNSHETVHAARLRQFPFFASGLVTDGRPYHYSPPAKLYVRRAVRATRSQAQLRVTSEVNMISGQDPTAERVVNGVRVNECLPGKQTAQNEFSIAVNPSDLTNIVVGANDYRLYQPGSNRFDASGGFFRSTDGGRTWTAGFLPDLVLGNATDPGPYQVAGDPSVAAGPNDVFWYSNIAFNRTDAANSVAVSRSVDGGATWRTSYIIQVDAAGGQSLFNDKPWIAADPKRKDVAYVTWTQFGETLDDPQPIVYSATKDGGRNWSVPRAITSQTINQASASIVDERGNLHVVWLSFTDVAGPSIAYAVKRRASRAFARTRTLTSITMLPGTLRWGKFRTPTFPALARDGNDLHVVWNEWNGQDGDILYIRSLNNGRNWSQPVAIDDRSSDQFFPWIAADDGKVFVAYLDHNKERGNTYHATAVGSEDGGETWTAPKRISSKRSRPAKGNKFRPPACEQFIGDYIGIAMGLEGRAHPVWVDVRFGNDRKGKADHDPYTAILRFTD